MTISVIGVIFAIAYIVVLLVAPSRLIWVIAAAVPFAQTAMIQVPAVAVNPFYFGLLLAAARYAHHKVGDALHPDRAPQRAAVPGRLLRLGFLVYATAITIIGPWLFEGTPVLTPRGGIDDQLANLTPLAPTISNVAQLSYLILGYIFVLYVERERNVTPRVFEISIAIGLGIALATIVLGGAFPRELFDNVGAMRYDVWGTRLRGSFAEPSIFGAFLAACLAYLVSVSAQARGARLAAYVVGIALSLYMYVLSYSGTALVALAILAGVAAFMYALRLTRKRLTGAVSATFLLLAVSALLVVGGAQIIAFVDDQFSGKLGTDSFSFRSQANDVGWEAFLSSSGIGVGLGSNRPSSLFFMLLSCVGIVGALLFFGWILSVIFASWRSAVASPVAWALLGVVLAQIAAKPDLSMPTMWITLALASAASARLQAPPFAVSTAPPAVVSTQGTLVP